jgi:hypothetical protein
MQTKQTIVLDQELLIQVEPYLKDAGLSLQEYIVKHLKKTLKQKKRSNLVKSKNGLKRDFRDFIGGLNELDTKSLQEMDRAMLDFRKNFKLDFEHRQSN